MTRKEKREWKELWGNSGLTETELLSKVMLILFNYPQGISFHSIYSLLFEGAQGAILEDNLRRVVTQLKDEGLIGLEPSSTYRLTGKGIKCCRTKIAFFKNHPYELYYWEQKTELVFTKYLPIIFSALALLISFLSYNFILHNK
jgi:hypothetical protein